MQPEYTILSEDEIRAMGLIPEGEPRFYLLGHPFYHRSQLKGLKMGCQFITSKDRPWKFCGKAPVPGKPYCAGHWEVTHSPRGLADLATQPDPSGTRKEGLSGFDWPADLKPPALYRKDRSHER